MPHHSFGVEEIRLIDQKRSERFIEGIGGPNQSRTGDLSMPWTYDPNFTMGPFLFFLPFSQYLLKKTSSLKVSNVSKIHPAFR
jgi:hypothetical protein